MIRMIQSSSAGQAKAYFNDSLHQSDYYLNGQEQPGLLAGQIAARLGLDGPANRNVFQALCENINPVTGRPLTLRTKAHRTVGYDINFHCPKSVSILHALTNDSHVLDAFQASVLETMRDIEADAQTRIRKNGKDEDRQTGELIWADFIHQTARPVDNVVPDPHLHCHAFVFNVTWDDVEGQFKAGQFRAIKQDMPYYQARFHKRLADRLVELGYRIRRTETAFEIVGVPEPIIDLFSKRTDEIGRIAQELGLTDPAALDQLGARTRSRKQKGLTIPHLKQAWREQIFALGLRDKGDGEQAIRFAPIKAPLPPAPQHCVDHAVATRFERASVMPDRRILETAYRQGLGHPALTIQQITDAFAQDTRIIRVKDGDKMLCTTQDVLREEQRMVALAHQGNGAMQPLYPTAPAMALAGEQADAVSHVLTTTHRVSIIRGRAGTGKTTLMSEAVQLIAATGHRVTVVAPTAQAARGVLREEGFTDAETVAALLASPALQANLANGVLWVDEAGLLNTADMTALLDIAIARNARLILSGDTRQHASVVRGDALRVLNTVAGIKAAEVSRIYRQRDEVYRQAVQALSAGEIRTGFDLLDSMQAIRHVDPTEPFAVLAHDYVATLKRGKIALVICPTHRQGKQVTQAIRTKLRESGRIGPDEIPVTQLVNTNRTVAEKADPRTYRVGHVVQFNRTAPGLSRGSRWQVATVTDTSVAITNARGDVRHLPLGDRASFDVFAPATLDLSTGDAVRITRNGFDANGRRVNNGQLLHVVGIRADGTIDLRNRISKVRYALPDSFGHLAHAHCITSHAAQGKTVDAVFIAQPASTFGATNLNQFYVSVSRARESVHIYTDDKDALLAQAALPGERLSALELVQKKKTARRRADQVMRNSQPVTAPPTVNASPPNAQPQPVKPVPPRKPVRHAPRP